MPNAAGRIILAIETSNPSADAGAGVALTDQRAGWTDVELLRPSRQNAPGSPRPGHGGQDDDLMPAIDRLCARRSVRPPAIQLVMVSIGPGGYTGLRIACAVGKMIAEVAGAPCIAVPTALVVARRVDEHAWSSGGVAVALASKADSVWLQRVERDSHAHAGHIIRAPDLEPLAASGLRTIIADRFLPAPIRAAAAALNITITEPIFDAAALFELPIGPTPPALPEIDPIHLVPLYPREPDAVTLWREKHNPQAS